MLDCIKRIESGTLTCQINLSTFLKMIESRLKKKILNKIYTDEVLNIAYFSMLSVTNAFTCNG